MKQLCCEIKPHIECTACGDKICSYCVPASADIDAGHFFASHPFVDGMPTTCRMKGVNLVGRWSEGGVFEMHETG